MAYERAMYERALQHFREEIPIELELIAEELDDEGFEDEEMAIAMNRQTADEDTMRTKVLENQEFREFREMIDEFEKSWDDQGNPTPYNPPCKAPVAHAPVANVPARNEAMEPNKDEDDEDMWDALDDYDNVYADPREYTPLTEYDLGI